MKGKMTTMAKREIRPIGPEVVEQYLEVYLNAYPAFKSLDDECRQFYREKTIFDMTNDKEVDFIGMFDGDKLIATMKLVNFQMNVYGRMQPAVGLMSLAVHPLFKKQGAALAMVRYYEAYAAERSDIAVLLPFRMDFYRKMGYGLGGKMDEYHIPTLHLPKCKDLSHIRLLSREDIDAVLACHTAFAKANHGMLIKYEEEIRDMRADESTIRVGYEEGGELVGYAAYHFAQENDVNYTMNRIVVDELIYSDGTVLRALLGYLRNQTDLAETIVIRSGEEDFYHLLPDAADVSGNYIPFGYLQTNVSAMGNMYKVMDPEKFVAHTDYRQFPAIDKTVRFQYLDEMASEEKSLTVAFADGRWSVAKEDAKVDATITCAMSDLSALLMNCGRLASFVRLGVMTIDNPAETPVLDMLLYYAQKPFSNSDF